MTCGLIHIYFIDDFVAFIDSQKEADCVCSAPEVLPLAPAADAETVAAWEFAKSQRKTACLIECPPLPADCQLQRLQGDTEAEYRERCAAVK